MVWKPINGFENYGINKNGDVINLSKGNILKPTLNKYTGYYQVSLKKNSKGNTKTIHRLVAETFLCKPVGNYEVNHIDGDKTNNTLINLEWLTRSDNLKRAYANKLHDHDKLIERGIKAGEGAINSLGHKLSLINFNTGEVKSFHSKRQAVKELGICGKQLNLVLNDETGIRRVGSYKRYQ